MKKALSATIVCLLGLTGLRLGQGFGEGAKEGAKPALQVTIKAPQAEYKAGERILLQMFIKNVSDKTVRIIGYLDGSDFGWRYPKYTLIVKDAEGKAVPRPPAARCGNTNALGKADFVTLKPGDSLDPLSIEDGPIQSRHYFVQRLALREAGKYSIQITYDTRGQTAEDWNGKVSSPTLSPEVQELLKEVPRGLFESNVLQVTVK